MDSGISRISITGSLDDLPSEVVLGIFSSGALTWRDFYSLILTSRRTSILAKPFLYENFSTNFTYSCSAKYAVRKGIVSAIGPLLANLARQPEHRQLVKRIELSLNSDFMNLKVLKPAELESLERLMRDYGHGMIHGKGTLPAGRHHLVTLLLTLCSDVQELVVNDEGSYPEDLWQSIGHKFPSLRCVRIHGTCGPAATRWGEDELDFRTHAFWIKAPALQRFEVRGAGRSTDHIIFGEDEFCGDTDIGSVERGSLSVRELVLEDCLLPMHSVGGEFLRTSHLST